MSQITPATRPVSDSPYTPGSELFTPNSHRNVSVISVDSVWREERRTGWIYRGSDKQNYFQPDYEYGTRWTAGFDANDLLGGLFKALKKLNPLKWFHLEYQSNAGEGDVQPLRDQAKGATVLRSTLAPVPYAGTSVVHCPFAIGSHMPSGSGHATIVTDVNVISLRGRPVGFLYRGADGHRYIQNYNGNGSGISIGPGAKGFGIDVDEGLYGPVERFTGMLPPGASLQRTIITRQPLVGEGQSG